MKNFIFGVFVLLFFQGQLHAQDIKGKVLDENGMGLPGVSVSSLNSSTVSDIDGNFTINAQLGESLKFTFLGYQDRNVSASNNMSVTMTPANTDLTEVIVIGYGTRKKADNTGSISQLSADDITQMKVLNPTQSIQGKAAGVQVIGTDTPGSSPSLIIRGIGTALGGRTPLFVVDGIPTENINNLNSNDIASYDILKDASSLAIYGNRAANGVVIITTKKGRGEKTTFEFDSFLGFRNPLKKVDMASANQFATYANVAEGQTRFATNQPYNTDWFDEITRQGRYSSTNLSMYGSTEKIDYLASVNYYDEEAILNGLDFSRLTLRNNNDYKISDRFKISQTVSAAFSKSKPKPLSAFSSAYRQSPLVPVQYPDGKWGVPFIGADGLPSQTGASFNNVGNPVSQLFYFTEEQKNILLQASISGEYKITDYLTFTSRIGVEYNSFKSFNYVPSRELWLAADPTRTVEQYSASEPINRLTTRRTNYFNWNFDNFLTFNKVFSDIHDIEITLGTTADQRGGVEVLEATGRNVPENSNYWSLNFSADPSNVQVVNTIGNDRRVNGYFGRFQYTLMNKYLLTGTFRRDGSSQFQDSNKWGNFPSFGLGWIVSNESFLNESKNINLLKFRGGWGRLGNQNVPLNIQSFASGLNASLGGDLYSGISITSFVDPSLGWEITEEVSVGVDFRFFEKLSGSFDWYDKNTENVVLNINPALTVGSGGATAGHAGEVNNEGYEISLRWDDSINDDLSYYIGVNFSKNKNNVTSIYNPLAVKQQGGGIGNGQYTKLLVEGQPIGSFYLYEVEGYDADGNFTYVDQNNDGEVNEDDRKFFGSSLPTSYYGINLGVTYKGIDLAVSGYGVDGNKVYNGKKAQRFGGENIEASVANDFWTPTNTNASNPAPSNTVPLSSNYYLESGSFFRINNITLGYTLPKFSKEISSTRIYASAINPFITQKFSGYSPELNGDGNPMGSQGIELDAYPTLRSLLFGINVKF